MDLNFTLIVGRRNIGCNEGIQNGNSYFREWEQVFGDDFEGRIEFWNLISWDRDLQWSLNLTSDFVVSLDLEV